MRSVSGTLRSTSPSDRDSPLKRIRPDLTRPPSQLNRGKRASDPQAGQYSPLRSAFRPLDLAGTKGFSTTSPWKQSSFEARSTDLVDEHAELVDKLETSQKSKTSSRSIRKATRFQEQYVRQANVWRLRVSQDLAPKS